MTLLICLINLLKISKDNAIVVAYISRNLSNYIGPDFLVKSGPIFMIGIQTTYQKDMFLGFDCRPVECVVDVMRLFGQCK